MGWKNEVREDAICGTTLSLIKGVFGVSLFTRAEVDEINDLKKLTFEIVEKSTKMTTDQLICDGIIKEQAFTLEKFVKTTPLETVTAGAVSATKVVCYVVKFLI